MFFKPKGVIMIAKLLQNFMSDFMSNPSQSFIKEQNLTLRPKDGTKCVLSIRS